MKSIGGNNSGRIPDGTKIRIGVVYTDSLYYDNLAAFGVTPKKHKGENKGSSLPPSHAMSVCLRQGSVLIPMWGWNSSFR